MKEEQMAPTLQHHRHLPSRWLAFDQLPPDPIVHLIRSFSAAAHALLVVYIS
jgi:hypothetical protein